MLQGRLLSRKQTHYAVLHSSLEGFDVSGHNAKITPVLWMAGEQQHLMTLGRIEEHPLHLRKALLIAMYQSIVEDDQGRPPRLLQQVGIGQAGSTPFPRTV